MTFEYQDLINTPVPFVWGGRDPRTGLDCWGLARLCLERQGLNPPEYVSSEEARANGLTAEQAVRCDRWQSLNAPEVGCVVALRNPPGFHCGVVVGRNRFIHVLRDTCVCVERLSSPLWRYRIAGFYRWPKENA